VSITGFEVVDLDLGVGVVTVHLTTALGGVVTLNEDYIGTVLPSVLIISALLSVIYARLMVLYTRSPVGFQ
jgi:hypothetical protein